MLVGVDVIRRQPGLGETGELRADLRRQFCARNARGGQGQPQPRHIVAKAAIALGQRWDACGGQHRQAVRQHHMQPNPEARVPARDADGLRHAGRTDHQRGGGEDTRTMCLFDGLVHTGMEAEIIGGEDEPRGTHPQAASG